MEFGVLGSVEARDDGRELPLGGSKQRGLLAILLLHTNEVVSRDRLIDGLWGERPPATAAHTLDNYISRLRKVLGDDRITRRPPGYALRLDRGELDLERFEQLVALGREQLVHQNAGEAAATLRAALAIWRGTALADVLYEPFAALEAERLEERRLSALEERIEADLTSGCSADLVAELEQLVCEHPFRERLVGQLMLALYRSGRQAKALEEYRVGKRRLAEELGLEPSPLLQRLERHILEQDPSLEPAAAPARVRQRSQKWSRRRLVALGVVTAASAASAAIGIALGTGGTSASSVTAGSGQVVALNLASGAPTRGVPFAGAPAAIAAGSGSLWLADPSAGTVSRLDLAARAVVDRIPVGASPGALAAGGGSVWAASVPGDSVNRIDPETGKVTQTVPLGGARAAAIAFGEGSLWIADIIDNSLIELDPASGLARRTLTLHLRPTALAIVEGTIWVADYDAGSVAEVDPRTGQTVVTVHVGNGPTALTAGQGALWVANALDSTVSRVDPASGSVVATIPVGSGPAAIAVAGGSVWVANQYSGTVSRIDPNRNAVARTTPVGGFPTALVAADDRIWVGVRPLARHRGGTLVLLHTRPISIDPAVQLDLFSLVSDSLTRDGLVTYNHVPGPAGIQLVPDLAVSVPLPTDGGTTYTFRLRPRIRYSDGRQLRAADFRSAIERVFRLASQGRGYFANIVGAEACAPPNASTCDLSRGIVTDEAAQTVSFHLRAPDPDFLSNLTIGGLATPVPRGTPSHDTGFEPIPGTGPYKIASASRREIRYVRSPFFREWSHAAQPDGNPAEIVMRFGLTPEQEVRAIQEGRADWMADNVPARLLPVLRTRFAGRQHSFSIPTTDFFKFNTTRPPFDDVRVRQALNLAIDRRAIVRIYGGRDLATPTCQVLPPGIPGYHRYCPYTRNPGPAGTWTAPDLARAHRLVAASGTRGTRVTVWGWTDDPTISPRVVRYTAGLLRRLGYPARVHFVPHAFLAYSPASVFRTIQVIPAAWGDTPYGFFTNWFSCAGANVRGWFCDRRIDREILRAQSLKATNPRAAASLWARIDHELVDRAVWAPLINEHGIDFVSARVRNYQFHSYWGLIADQLWLR
jgi:YVTN family beta-propeller protein